MSMNAASSLYVHPELTDSEVWFATTSSAKFAAYPHPDGRSYKTAVYATLATISLAAASVLTVLKLTSIGNDNPFVNRWL